MYNYSQKRKIPKNHILLKNYSPIVSQLLYNREINTKKEAETFLNPQWKENHDPFLLLNMKKAVERFYEALQKNEFITIYADYDADGIPGSVILANLLQKISYKNFTIYIPHRHHEGYGIHTEALKKIKDQKSSLIISIDVGITAHEAAKWCKKNNIDLIITDHHLPLQKNGKDNLPDAFTIINPKQNKDVYPDHMLCGAGVIFKFIQAFIQKYGNKYQIHPEWEKWLLDMVGIATISDMVPLKKENRIFAYYGVKVIQEIAKDKKNHRIGLKTLLRNANIHWKFLTEDDIGFGISPRINAASRMSHPEDALNVFLAKNEIQAINSVKKLTQLNDERKKLTKKTTQEAFVILKKEKIEELIIIGKKEWETGILGLVASKLVEKYRVPVFVWSEENGIIKGSCRSLDELHLIEIMSEIPKNTLLYFGGHAEAGGFSCKKENITILKQELLKSIKKYKKKNKKRKITQKNIDMELSIDNISIENYKEIRKLAPFGIGNEKPLFIFKNVLIDKIGTFGKDKNHLEIFFKNSLGKTIRGIAFFKIPSDFEKLKKNNTCNIIANLEYSVFREKHELRLRIIDIV